MTEPGAIEPELLEIIVCPRCRSDLLPHPDAERPESLRCSDQKCGLVYPVRDGIPVLLVDEAGHEH